MVSIAKRKSQIIKKDNAVVSGKICIGAGSQVAPVRNASASAPIPPKDARVIESTAEYVLIEVHCQCGSTIKLKCDYADISLPALF